MAELSPRMADDDTLEARLRAATAEDVEKALAACNGGAEIEMADAADLLEFFNRMLDTLLTRR